MPVKALDVKGWQVVPLFFHVELQRIFLVPTGMQKVQHYLLSDVT
jgi:hypothetical protein